MNSLRLSTRFWSSSERSLDESTLSRNVLNLFYLQCSWNSFSYLIYISLSNSIAATAFYSLIIKAFSASSSSSCFLLDSINSHFAKKSIGFLGCSVIVAARPLAITVPIASYVRYRTSGAWRDFI